MNIKLISNLDEDCNEEQSILIDWNNVWYSRDLSQDCPEDATLARSMTNGQEILNLMQAAFEAWQKGESFIVYKEFNTN